MIKVNIEVNNKSWNKKLKNPKSYFNKKLKKIAKFIKFFKSKNITFTILLTNSLNMKKLNKKFRKKNKSTDVLSFPFYSKKELKIKLKKEREIYLGDIIINLNKIKEKNSKKSFKLEFNKLWVHGLAHLFGYKHKKNKDFYNMSRFEKKFISLLN